METLPKWFWIALGAIVVITIAAIAYCSYKNKTIVTDATPNVNDLNVIDEVASLDNAIG